MLAIDQTLAGVSYHHARAAQERKAALSASDERSRNAHLHLAVVHEVYSVFGSPPPRAGRRVGGLSQSPGATPGVGRLAQAATFCREARLRSCGSRKRFLNRIDLGVTSTISSSSI